MVSPTPATRDRVSRWSIVVVPLICWLALISDGYDLFAYGATLPGLAAGAVGRHAWFMDNGDHDYVTTMLGAGTARGPVHLVRVSLTDADDHELVTISGARGGSITNPPLFDDQRRVAVAYDSANGVLAAFRFEGGRLHPLWRRRHASAGHMLLFPDTGELVAYDFHPSPGRSHPPGALRGKARSEARAQPALPAPGGTSGRRGRARARRRVRRRARARLGPQPVPVRAVPVPGLEPRRLLLLVLDGRPDRG